MATEQDTTLASWQQLQQQQQFQQSPQSADLVTYHESDPRPGEEGYEDEEEAPNIRSEPEPRENAVVEGDDADLEEAKREEEQPDEDFIEDTIEIPIQNSYGDEQTQAVSIRGNKEAVEKFKSERMAHTDYTRKTTELARQRDGVAEAVRQAQDQARTQYVQQLETWKNTVISTLEPELRNIDWQKLSTEDPQEYLRLSARGQQLRSQVEQMEGQQRQIAELQAREDYQRLQQRIQESREVVAQTIPGWSDQRYSEILTTVAQKYGFSLEEVGTVVDPRIIRILNDVTKYHQGSEKRDIVRKKIAHTPKAIPAGPAPKPRTGDSRDQMRFRKTGSMVDGAKVLAERLLNKR
jgi:hypothetical protein